MSPVGAGTEFSVDELDEDAVEAVSFDDEEVLDDGSSDDELVDEAEEVGGLVGGVSSSFFAAVSRRESIGAGPLEVILLVDLNKLITGSKMEKCL